jgi:hypothetical protein
MKTHIFHNKSAYILNATETSNCSLNLLFTVSILGTVLGLSPFEIVGKII